MNTDGRPYAHLTLGMESKDGMSAADILHVRGGPELSCGGLHPAWNGCGVIPWYWKASPVWHRKSALSRVRPYAMENGSYKAMPDMPFTQWENPYFTVDPPEQGDTFTIYQLKGGPETRDYRFEAYESLQGSGAGR